MSLYEFHKSDLEKIVFELSDFRGKTYINIRLWIRKDPLSKEWRPTKKGLFIPLELATEFTEGMAITFSAIEKRKEENLPATR